MVRFERRRGPGHSLHVVLEVVEHVSESLEVHVPVLKYREDYFVGNMFQISVNVLATALYVSPNLFKRWPIGGTICGKVRRIGIDSRLK
jgi:hypothetical protein